jgi:hypothetical protein
MRTQQPLQQLFDASDAVWKNPDSDDDLKESDKEKIPPGTYIAEMFEA